MSNVPVYSFCLEKEKHLNQRNIWSDLKVVTVWPMVRNLEEAQLENWHQQSRGIGLRTDLQMGTGIKVFLFHMTVHQ